MAQSYDKIFKENIGEFFLTLSEKYLGIRIAKSQELKDKLQTTLEREADFLRLIQDETGKQLILHLEFQTQNEKNMVYRMQEYFAILQKKHQLPIRQFVIYISDKEMTMTTTLPKEEVYTGFEVLNLQKISYQKFLQSDIPEEIILAILANFEKEEVEKVLQQIIKSLGRTGQEQLKLEKYIRQITVLSRLRNLSELTEKIVEKMAWTYDIETDAFYKRGLEKGMEKGMEKSNIKGIQNALKQQVLTVAQIADLFEVEEAFVLKIQKGEVASEE